MSFNRSLLSQITKDLKKKPSKPNVPKNQWQHPGEITTIPSNNITMDAVSYPVLGVPDFGQPQMMYPDQQYHFPDAGNVTEYPMMAKGGYTVTRSHDRKGKTHKVTGPDGTVKYFGDSKLGQHPKDPKRKAAFYARHKKNLEHNPYFRAFARATWQTGGESEDLMQYALSRMKMTPSSPTMDQIETVAGFIPGIESAIDLKDMIMGAVTGNYAQMQRGKIGAVAPLSGKALMGGLDMASPGSSNAINEVLNMSKTDQAKLFKKYGYGGYDQWVKAGRPKLEQGGEMIRRADGSYSRRGLWDNIRANKGSGKKPTKEMLEQERKIKSKMQFGGLWDTNRTAWVDSVNNANMDKNFVQRMYNANAPEMFLPGSKKPSTHFMESGDSRVYPTVVQRPGNKFLEWLNQNNPDGAMNYALDSGQYIQFPHDEQAQWYGQNGYKSGTGVVTGKKKKYGGLAQYQKAGQVKVPKGYVNIEQQYGLQEGTKEYYDKALELYGQDPSLRFMCKGDGCAKIAVDAANAYTPWYSTNYNRGDAWQIGNKNSVDYQNPTYAGLIEAKNNKPLPNPTSYNVAPEFLEAQGSLIGLNRNNNKASIKYAKPEDSRLYEHIGYQIRNGLLLHGTKGNDEHPNYFILDDMSNGVKLNGIGQYEPTEIINRPSIMQRLQNRQQGGSIYDYMTSHGMNGSFASRKKLFNQYFGTGYTGTADQNMQMLQMMQQGKFKAPAQPMMATPYAPKPTFPGATTGLSFLNQTKAPYVKKQPIYKAPQKPSLIEQQVDSSIPDVIRKGLSYIGIPTNVSQLALHKAGMDSRMSNESLSDDEKIILYQTILNAQKRTGNPTKGGTAYVDYGNQGYGSPEDYRRWIVNGDIQVNPETVKNQFTNPGFRMATTVGRGSYQVDPKDPNVIHYTDSYDFVKHDKDELFKTKDKNSYQSFRTGLSEQEDPNAESDPMRQAHFTFNKKDMDALIANKRKAVASMRNGGYLQKAVVGMENPFFPKLNPEQEALDAAQVQLPDDTNPFGVYDAVSHEGAGIAGQMKTKIEKEAAAGSYNNTNQKKDKTSNPMLNPFMAINTFAQGVGLYNKQQQEEANRQMLRSQNATWNQQYDSMMNRGNFSQGPSSYGMFRPNATFAQQGMEVPLSMDAASKYTVDSIDSQVGVNTIGVGLPDVEFAQPTTQVEDPALQSPEQVTPTNAAAPASEGDLKEIIAQRESGGNYKALPYTKKGTLASSAAGKYQFLWDTHADTIRTVTGVKSKSQFLNNPDAQEAYFDYWDKNVLTPNAQKIQQQYKPNLSTNEIKMLIHFQGPQGADRYFRTGKYTTDAFGSSPMGYLGKNINTKKGVNIDNLHPNLASFASTMSQYFPGLKISSANDSKHMKGSKHYANKAIDIGANSSDPVAYNRLKNFLGQSASVKRQYGIEDIINEGDHLHVELMKTGGEYELTADQIMQIKAMGGDVEFI